MQASIMVLLVIFSAVFTSASSAVTVKRYVRTKLNCKVSLMTMLLKWCIIYLTTWLGTRTTFKALSNQIKASSITCLLTLALLVSSLFLSIRRRLWTLKTVIWMYPWLFILVLVSATISAGLCRPPPEQWHSVLIHTLTNPRLSRSVKNLSSLGAVTKIILSALWYLDLMVSQTQIRVSTGSSSLMEQMLSSLSNPSLAMHTKPARCSISGLFQKLLRSHTTLHGLMILVLVFRAWMAMLTYTLVLWMVATQLRMTTITTQI